MSFKTNEATRVNTLVKDTKGTGTVGILFRSGFSRLVGLFILLFGAIVYVQILPVIFAFIGILIGIPATGAVGSIASIPWSFVMNLGIWLLTSAGALVLLTKAYCKAARTVWVRFVQKPKKVNV